MKRKPIKKKHIIIPVALIIFVCIILGFIGYLLFIKQVEGNNVTGLNPLYKKVYTLLNQEVDPDSLSVNSNSYVWWISKDNLNIINNNALSIEANYHCDSYNYKTSRYEPSLIEIARIFPQFMKKQGFTRNILNSSTSLSDNKFYDYVQAYEKDNLKCTLTGDPDCRGLNEDIMRQTIKFSCTSDFEKNYREQMPFLKDLRINDGIINISKRIDNFVYLDAHARRSGWYIIAILQANGTWKQIMAGQDYPRCSVMEQYSVPKEIYGSCL